MMMIINVCVCVWENNAITQCKTKPPVALSLSLSNRCWWQVTCYKWLAWCHSARLYSPPPPPPLPREGLAWGCLLISPHYLPPSVCGGAWLGSCRPLHTTLTSIPLQLPLPRPLHCLLLLFDRHLLEPDRYIHLLVGYGAFRQTHIHSPTIDSLNLINSHLMQPFH